MEIQLGTDVGQRRLNNEDYVGNFVNKAGQPLVLLADGMGGHQAGDIASKKVVEDIGQQWKYSLKMTVEQVQTWLTEQIHFENDRLLKLWEENEALYGMGTTLVALAFIDTKAVLVHVGDSRAYAWTQEDLHLLTEDHSLVNMLLKSGEITEEMAAHHPKRHMLTSTVGMESKIEIETSVQETQQKGFLLCSDGLSNMLTAKEMLACLEKEATPLARVQALLQKANQAGGLDNITVALVDYTGEED